MLRLKVHVGTVNDNQNQHIVAYVAHEKGSCLP